MAFSKFFYDPAGERERNWIDVNKRGVN